MRGEKKMSRATLIKNENGIIEFTELEGITKKEVFNIVNHYFYTDEWRLYKLDLNYLMRYCFTNMYVENEGFRYNFIRTNKDNVVTDHFVVTEYTDSGKIKINLNFYDD